MDVLSLYVYIFVLVGTWGMNTDVQPMMLGKPAIRMNLTFFMSAYCCIGISMSTQRCISVTIASVTRCITLEAVHLSTPIISHAVAKIGGQSVLAEAPIISRGTRSRPEPRPQWTECEHA